MPEAQLIKHRCMARCEKAMEMQIMRRDVEMAEKYRDMEFSLYGN